MPFTSQEIERVLETKFGFEFTASKHRHLKLELAGLPTVFTMVSHGCHEPGPALQAKMARQLRVSLRVFKGMIECPVSRDEYIAILADYHAGPHPNRL